MNRPRKSLKLVLIAAGFLLAACLVSELSLAPSLYAQAKQERVVDGKVVNKAEAPMSGAVVYLKDAKSLNVKTYICDEAGHFHFGQVSQNADYELWAESNGVKSNTKSISSFDDKNSYYFTLTIK